MSRWASGVTLVAVRVDGRVVATTVSAFASVSLEPPLVLLALGPHATVLPFLTAGARCGVSILSAAQQRLATVFADPYPVGPDPFGPDDPPVVAGSLVALRCTVRDVHAAGDHVLVLAAADAAEVADGPPLVRFRRRWHRLDHP